MQLALTCPPTERAWHRERRLELLLWKVEISSMGATGWHGGGHWFSFLLQAPTARSNTQTEFSRMSLSTVTTARLQFASASPP